MKIIWTPYTVNLMTMNIFNYDNCRILSIGKLLKNNKALWILGVKQYGKKRIAIYCNMADPYCNTYCNMLYMTFCVPDHL